MTNPSMQTSRMRTYATRDTILKLLSDDELRRVATLETAAKLDDGDEYLDLAHLESGVRKALGLVRPLGDVLPRKALLASTWAAILLQLAAPSTGSTGTSEPLPGR